MIRNIKFELLIIKFVSRNSWIKKFNDIYRDNFVYWKGKRKYCCINRDGKKCNYICKNNYIYWEN